MYSGLNFDQAPVASIPFRFFVTAPIFLILAGLLLAMGGAQTIDQVYTTQSIAWVHSLTLGWLWMVMAGSLYQMIPVVVGRKIPFAFLAAWIHASSVVSIIVFMVAMYLQSTVLMHMAGTFLLICIGLFFVQMSMAVHGFYSPLPTVWGMQFSVASLGAALGLGVFLVLALSGVFAFPYNRLALRGLHMELALVGWVGSLMIGLGLHVLPMFYLSPAIPKKKGQALVLAWMLGPIICLIAILFQLPQWLQNIGYLMTSVVSIVWAIGLWHSLGKARRKVVDTTLMYFKTGFVCLIAASTLLWVNLLSHGIFWTWIIYLYIAFAFSITTGMLYKIIPFLIWLHHFSSQVGKMPVPSTKQIGPDAPARRQWNVFVATLLVGLLALVFGEFVRYFSWNDLRVAISILWRLFGVLMCVTGALLLKQLIVMLGFPKKHIPKKV